MGSAPAVGTGPAAQAFQEGVSAKYRFQARDWWEGRVTDKQHN
jgi:hypothetical protein